MVKVLGLGDNIVDKYQHQHKMYPGGNSLNFSVYAKNLGADASYIGVVGTDSAAAHIVRVLKELEIDISHLRVQEGENAYAVVNLENGERVFAGHNDGGVRKLLPLQLNDEDLAYIKSFDHVHSSVYSEIDSELKKLSQCNVPVSYDFSNVWNLDVLEQICPHIQYALLSCGDMEEEAIRNVLEKLSAINPGLMTIATMGEQGSIVWYKGASYYHKPKYVQALDTLGAGDAFFTAFLLKWLELRQSRDEDQAIRLGLQEGADFAARICMTEGAFGHGIAY